MCRMKGCTEFPVPDEGTYEDTPGALFQIQQVVLLPPMFGTVVDVRKREDGKFEYLVHNYPWYLQADEIEDARERDCIGA